MPAIPPNMAELCGGIIGSYMRGIGVVTPIPPSIPPLLAELMAELHRVKQRFSAHHGR